MKRNIGLFSFFLAVFLCAISIDVAWATAPAVTSVTNLFQEKLGRTPDSASLDFWVKQARSGVSLNELGKLFATGTEAKTDIANAFATSLGRSATPAEITFWTGQLAAPGATLQSVLAQITSLAPVATTTAVTATVVAPADTNDGAPPALVLAPPSTCVANFESCYQNAGYSDACASDYFSCSSVTTNGQLGTP